MMGAMMQSGGMTNRFVFLPHSSGAASLYCVGRAPPLSSHCPSEQVQHLPRLPKRGCPTKHHESSCSVDAHCTTSHRPLACGWPDQVSQGPDLEAHNSTPLGPSIAWLAQGPDTLHKF